MSDSLGDLAGMDFPDNTDTEAEGGTQTVTDVTEDFTGLLTEDQLSHDLHFPDSDPNPIGLPVAVDVEALPTFDPSAVDGEVIGDPESQMEHWHMQEHLDTCAVVVQEYILNDLLPDADVTEEQLRQEAIDNGWYYPGWGTAPDDTGKLIEFHGFEVEREYGVAYDDLVQKLDDGEHVIVSVNAYDIWHPEASSWMDDILDNIPGIPGQPANHAVQVIGVIPSESGESTVILNDPGHPDGQGMLVPEDQFIKAWGTGDNFVVSTEGSIADTMPERGTGLSMSSEHRLGSGYNADGTWRSSDGNDYDAETGVIVRRHY